MMNLYGIDLKITPEEKPVIIEINGRQSGTEGFVNVYRDLRTQKKILSKMAEKAGDNGIYMTDMNAGSLNPLLRIALGIIWFQDILRLRLKYRGCSPQMDWIIDDTPKLYEKKLPQYFSEAAERLGINLFTYAHLLYEDDRNLIVNYVDGVERKHRGKERITPDDIGLIWSLRSASIPSRRKKEVIFPGPTDFDPKLVNPFPIENALHVKSYLHELLERTEFSDFLPKTELYGAGLTRDNYDFIETPMFVKKPNSYCRGYGLRIYPRNRLKWMLQKSKPKKENKKVFDMVKKAKNSVSFFASISFLRLFSSLIQEFVPSKPIHSDVTGKEHDGCMRAIVLDGEFIDGYWRLSPQPLDGYKSMKNLRRKYGANLSRGALAQRISESDFEIVKPFTERLVKVFEDCIDMYKDMNLWMSFETIYWLKNLMINE